MNTGRIIAQPGLQTNVLPTQAHIAPSNNFIYPSSNRIIPTNTYIGGTQRALGMPTGQALTSNNQLGTVQNIPHVHRGLGNVSGGGSGGVLRSADEILSTNQLGSNGHLPSGPSVRFM